MSEDAKESPPETKTPPNGKGKSYFAKRNQAKNWNVPDRFDGNNSQLKGHIYDTSDGKGATRFIQTTEQIAMYVSREYGEFADDAEYIMDHGQLPEMDEPEDLDPKASAARKKI